MISVAPYVDLFLIVDTLFQTRVIDRIFPVHICVGQSNDDVQKRKDNFAATVVDFMLFVVDHPIFQIFNSFIIGFEQGPVHASR